MSIFINRIIIICVTVCFFSCKTNTKEQDYIDKVKALERLNQKTDNCLNYINDNVETIYPITGDNIESTEKLNLISQINEYYSYNHLEVIRELICDGATIYNIDCNSNNSANMILMVYCNDNPIFYVLSIKDDKIIKKVKIVDSSLRTSDYDSVTSGYHDIDFKLEKGKFEVYKIYKILDEENSTEENRYPTKEVRREVTKYKLTDNGLVEL